MTHDPWSALHVVQAHCVGYCTFPDFAEVAGSQLGGELDFPARYFPVVTCFPRQVVHLRFEAWTWRCELTTEARR